MRLCFLLVLLASVGCDDGEVEPIDADRDGFAEEDDCDDDNADVHPDALEYCNRIDDDCDGDIDESEAIDVAIWFVDADGDGYGDPNSGEVACFLPADRVADDTDCDDADPALNPQTSWYRDADGDGYGNSIDALADPQCVQPEGYVLDDTDCADFTNQAFPGATELCDFLDNDCDGDRDEDDATDALTWYRDADSDGFGDPNSTTRACAVPSGYVGDDTDCDDADTTLNPATLWHPDQDGDGYGTMNPSLAVAGCTGPFRHVRDGTDCDDWRFTANPGEVEVCDGIDNTCDGLVDQGMWAEPDSPYRIPVRIDAPSHVVEQPPVAVDVDFGAALTALGEAAPFDPLSVRVVIEDCDLGFPEVPAEFAVGVQGLFDRVDPLIPTSTPGWDDQGSVVFFYDEDGNLDTAESPTPDAQYAVGIYFGGTGTAAPADGVTVSTDGTRISNDQLEVILDPTQGGLIGDLRRLVPSTSPRLLSSNVCCGNGYNGTSGWVSATDSAATLTVLADGALLAMVEAAGISGSTEQLDYRYQYFAFAGRPELWIKLRYEAATDAAITNATDYTLAIRPFRALHRDLVAGASSTVLENAADSRSASITASFPSGDTWGYAMGWAAAPDFVRQSYVSGELATLQANELAASGGPQLAINGGTVLVDNAVMVVLPLSSDYPSREEAFLGLLDRTMVEAGAPEAQ